MTWSDAQRKMVHRAAHAAGWNEQQRYIAMKEAGCPLVRNGKVPSTKDPRNSNTHFELYMELAEACAGARGAKVPPPREKSSWREVCIAKHYHGWFGKAKAIAAEAIERMPGKFNDGLLQYAIEHTTPEVDLIGLGAPEGLAECTPPHLYRVVELLRAMVGREFARAGLAPRTFEIPREARRRAG